MQTMLMFMYTESPLHAGAGSGISSIDLPIQRERITQHPIVQGSGIKGALRQQSNGTEVAVNAIYGRPAGDNINSDSDYAGAVSFGEAHVVLFPVQSLAGVFAYVTCPLVLSRLKRDAERAGIATPNVPVFDKMKDDQPRQCMVTSQTPITRTGDTVVLEEFSFDGRSNALVDLWGDWLLQAFPHANSFWGYTLIQRLVILPDDDFRDFVVNSTQIDTHIRLNRETKTVQQGALWTQESLPAETLLISLVTTRALRVPSAQGRNEANAHVGGEASNAVAGWLKNNTPAYLQVGGDETTGQGLVSIRFMEAQYEQ